MTVANTTTDTKWNIDLSNGLIFFKQNAQSLLAPLWKRGNIADSVFELGERWKLPPGEASAALACSVIVANCIVSSI